MIILKNKFYNHFKALESGLYLTLLIILAIYFIGNDSGFSTQLYSFFGIFYIINLLPALYLHLEYYICNRKEVYEITKNELIRYKNGKRNCYSNDEIHKIVIYMAPSIYRRSNLHFLAIEGYYFARVFTKNGEELNITCLLSDELEEAVRLLSNSAYERKKVFFATLLI